MKASLIPPIERLKLKLEKDRARAAQARRALQREEEQVARTRRLLAAHEERLRRAKRTITPSGHVRARIDALRDMRGEFQ